MDYTPYDPNVKRPIQKIYEAKKDVYVYGLIDPRDSSLFWVGMTNSLRHRYDQHYFNIGEKDRAKQKLVEDILKSGNQPGMILIEEFNTRREAEDLEKSLIVFLSGVSNINLANIEHKPDKTWSFKTRLKAERQGQLWETNERLVMIGMYQKGAFTKLIAQELGRKKKAVDIELHRAALAEFLTIREPDQPYVKASVKDSKYPVKCLPADEVTRISVNLHRVTSKYGELNATHYKQEFKPVKAEEAKEKQ